jgi:dTDP-4-amino-4,6-dideoxygalactose transaminase
MQHVPFNDLKREHDAIQAELAAATMRVLESGYYILGPEVTAFEHAFAEYVGVPHCLGVANGTEAIQLALQALGVGWGDEVITVANAGVPGVAAIVALGARPVFVDVDMTTRVMDVAQLEAAITVRTKAILPVHLYGIMADMPAIMAIASRHGLPVVEDVAQAHGARWGTHVAGSMGDIAAFSFYPTKNLGAVGDGGAITTGRNDLAQAVRQLRQYGWERKYHTGAVSGINSRLDELQAAMLTVKLRYLAARNQRRVDIATYYNERLAQTPVVTPVIPAHQQVVFHLYVMTSERRDDLAAYLRQHGVGSDIHYPLATHHQPPYRQYAPAQGLPVSEHLAKTVLSLPNFPDLSDAEVEYVANRVVQFFDAT